MGTPDDLNDKTRDECRHTMGSAAAGGPPRLYSYDELMDLLREIAWDDLGVEVSGNSVRAILHQVYQTGGDEAVLGLVTIAKVTGLPLDVVVLNAADKM